MIRGVRISLIVAMTLDGVIGVGGDLPWHISEDLRFFKSKTYGGAVLMGRRTFESMGGALGGRYNVVISRGGFEAGEDVGIFGDLGSGLDSCVDYVLGVGGDEVFVIGGGEIFGLSLGLVDRFYITEVDLVVGGDVYFPEFDFGGLGVVRGDWVEGVDGRSGCDVRYRFVEYNRA